MKVGERFLYITVFDHKERMTRIYTREYEEDAFYSTKSDAPHVDIGHFLLEVEIDAKIDPKGDPVCSDSNNLDSLRKHHRSILDNIRYRLGASKVAELYTIENSWTMKVEDTISTFQKLREENGEGYKRILERGIKEELSEKSLPIPDYFMHSSIERERQWLDERRGEWIARRMDMIISERKESEVGYRVDKKEVEQTPAVRSAFELERVVSEQLLMELLLLYEVMAWEKLFRKIFRTFLEKIGRDRVEE